jgi:hypothetical protein
MKNPLHAKVISYQAIGGARGIVPGRRATREVEVVGFDPGIRNDKRCTFREETVTGTV